jgi:hypothetical protein
MAWLLAPAGYLLLPLWGIRPAWPALLAACLLGVVAGVAAEQYALRKGRGR